MPPKRAAAAAKTQTVVKMIKIGGETQDVACDPDDKYRLSDSSSYSPILNQENETIEYDEEHGGSPGIRTDTISLLMKIEQLQAKLKYERRCRILAERELRELKEMNTLMMQMRHTAHELRATLDLVRQGSGEGTVASHNNEDEATTFLADNEVEAFHVGMHHHMPEARSHMMDVSENSADLGTLEDDNYLYLSEGLRVPKNLYERIAEITDFKKYTSALLMMLFDRETLATHSLQGRRTSITGEDSQKPQLPPEILRSIIDHVGIKFGVNGSQIKTAIRTKLNNEDKLLKKRMGFVKAENKVDQSFSQGDGGLSENAVIKTESPL